MNCKKLEIIIKRINEEIDVFVAKSQSPVLPHDTKHNIYNLTIGRPADLVFCYIGASYLRDMYITIYYFY